MEDQYLCPDKIDQFRMYLKGEERSRKTIEKYSRDIYAFYRYLGADKRLNKDKIINYKEYLKNNYKVSSANSMLASLNCLLEYLGLGALKVRSFRNQRQIFYDRGKELTKEEYQKLVRAALADGNERLAMVLQTICGTGIRIGELEHITVEAVRAGRAVVTGKGKNRVIIITKKLRVYLLKYCRQFGIGSGAIFITRSGHPMDRSNVWTEMKKLCKKAEVSSEKVFPHNLRHLFARTCYRLKHDIVYLADILGHSSIETTRIYTASSGEEHARMLSRLDLIL